MIEPRDLEKALILNDLVVRENIKSIGIDIGSFKYLVIANLLTELNKRFTKIDILNFVGIYKPTDISNKINVLVKKGYIEEVQAKRTFSRNGKTQTAPAYFKTTGKAVYLIRKYTDRLRVLISNTRFERD
jgi:hypothetical protein